MNRRQFLRNAMATIALPVLPSALPRTAWAATAPPVRLLFWYVPCGIQMDWFTPQNTGKNYDLPDILLHTASVQEHISVITGLGMEAGFDNLAGDHARGTGSFLTCRLPKYTAGSDIENGISVDQVYANAVGTQTALPSLNLALDPGLSTGGCDSGYSCAYSRNISWAGPSTPNPNVVHPRLVFERLFPSAGIADPERLARRQAMRKSILDHLMDETSDLTGKLGITDKRKLDEFLTGLRALEKRIDGSDFGTCSPDDKPGDFDTFQQHVELMRDLMVMAMRCDQTRAITFMLGEGGSNRSYDFLGVPRAHHEISHHNDDPANLADLVTIGQWEVQQYALLVQQMAGVEESDGSRLIDNALVYFGSEIEDGNSHYHRNMPILLAGKGGGKVDSGRHLVYGDNEPVADLFLAMLDAAGAPQESFGMDGTKSLDGIIS